MNIFVDNFFAEKRICLNLIWVRIILIICIALVSNSQAVTIEWDTFLGSAGNDDSYSFTIDGSGNIYIAGQSNGTWEIPVNPYLANDIFVAKLNPDGVLQWNTFLGGTGYDTPYSIELDGNNNIYICGSSEATWGTPLNAFAGGTTDAFVAKLDNSGVLQWNTFLGGNSSNPFFDDGAFGLALDTNSNIYVAGESNSAWGAPLNAFAGGTSDAFVTKLNNSGVLQWNTFLGGAKDNDSYQQDDSAAGIVLDANNNIYITGFSSETWGTPIKGFAGGLRDAFVVKLNNSGALQWNTFFGGSGDIPNFWWVVGDHAHSITLDTNGNIYTLGTNDGPWGTPVESYPPGTSHAPVITKFDANGQLQWHSYLGGIGTWGNAITLDNKNNILVTGEIQTTWDSTAMLPNGWDAFVAQFDQNGALLWHADLGGEGTDRGSGIFYNGGNNFFLIGRSDATWGAPVNPFQGNHDVFVTKIANNHDLSVIIKGNKGGGVDSTPAGISCPDDCEELLDFGTEVTLSALPDIGSTFQGWSGDCTGKELVCTVRMDKAKSIEARFYKFPWPVYLPTIIKNPQR